MKKLILLFVLLASGAQAQGLWTGWKRTITSSASIGPSVIDSTNIVDGGISKADLRVSIVDSTIIVNSGISKADLRVSIVDSSKIVDSGITKADLRVSIIDSSRVTNGGLINADLRVSTLDSTRVLDSGLTKADLRVSIIDSSRATDGGLINADLRVSTLDSTRIKNGTVSQNDLRTAAVGATQLASTTATAGSFTSPSITVDVDGRITASANLFPPIIFAADSASSMAADTTWIWQNWRGATVTVDSIIVYASSDDYGISFVERNPNGHLVSLIDAVTASTNGINTFYQKETTITAATIEAFHWIGFKRPTSTGDGVNVRIHYH
jgi:uncharacterized protein YjbI with pentapeptide repeats